MTTRFSKSRASRFTNKAAARKRALCCEWLEPRTMLSANPLAALGATASGPPTISHITISNNLAVSGKTAAISASATDPAGESLTYTWSATTVPSGGSVSFSSNGTTAAASSVATFNEAGVYDLTVTVVDTAKLSSSSTVAVDVNQTLSSLCVSNASTKTVVSSNTPVTISGTSEALAVQGLDQFGNVLTTQPTLTWSATTVPSGAQQPGFSINGKTVTVTFHKAGNYLLLATANDGEGHTATASQTVIVDQAATGIGSGAAATVTVNATSQQFTDPAVLDQFGTAMATQPGYTWVASLYPGGATVPTFSTSGTTTTAAFHKAGTYYLKASVNGVSTLGFNTTVTVNPVATNVVIPATTVTINGKSQQFSNPAVLDQFGVGMAIQPSLTWVATTLPGGAQTPAFNTSSTGTTVTFTKAGSYGLKAYVTNASTVAWNITATVNQLATSLASVPATTVTVTGTSQQISDPVVDDQFGNAMATQPAYGWYATACPNGATVPAFSTSGATTTVVFSKAGAYGLKAYVTSASTLTFSTTANVTQTFSGIAVSPALAAIVPGGTLQFTAQEVDQFYNALTTQPAFTWSASVGTITTAGLYTAPGTSGTATITAKTGTQSASASVSINGSNSLGLVDQTLANLVLTLDADGSINRLDMMQILRSVVANGSQLSATDLTDLRTIDTTDAAKLNIPGYVQVLAGDVLNSNPANLNYQGAALGNLVAGSSAAQVDDLVNKWFMGTDLPNSGNSLFVYEPASGTLFGPSGKPAIADEFQGALGDCYFISSLGTIAQSNPTAIENMFINNGDGTYTVRFYTGTYGSSTNSNGSTSDGFINGVGTADYVTVNSMLPTYNGRLVFADYGNSYTAANDLWIPLAEKAYAQWNETGKEGRDGVNGYADIQGGWMATVDAQALGYNATDYSLTTGNQQYIVAALAADEAVTAGTLSSSNSNDTLPYGLYGCHAYGITGYTASNQTFTFYNPWGFDQPPAGLTWAEVMVSTNVVTVVNTSGSTPISGSVGKPASVAGWLPASVSAASQPAVSNAADSDSEHLPNVADSDASASHLAAARSTSPSAAADATRSLFQRWEGNAKPAAHSLARGGAQTSEQLAAPSVDELFGNIDRILERAFV